MNGKGYKYFQKSSGKSSFIYFCIRIDTAPLIPFPFLVLIGNY